MTTSRPRYDLLRSRLDRFTRTLPGVESGEIKAIHRARVASRRLRELLPVLQLDGDVSRKVTRRLRKATRDLGGVRELDVLLMLTDELHESGRHSTRALNVLSADVRKIRDERRRDFEGKSSAQSLRKVGRRLEKLSRKLEEGDTARGERAWRWALDARVAHRAAALERAIQEAGAIYLSERLHDVRIAVKKLRYALELAAEASGSSPDDLRTLKRVQGLLGRLHDLQVLVDRVRTVQASLNPPDLTVSHDLNVLNITLDRSCRRLHARYVRDRETIVDICRRLALRARQTASKAGSPAAGGSRLRAAKTGNHLASAARRAG